MNSGAIDISIVICCYNSADVIADTLRSINNQRCRNGQNIEIILVDNGSNDSTKETADNFVRQSVPYFKYRSVTEQNRGLSHARLCGFKESSGEFVIMCDDDNRLAPDYTDNALNVMSSHPDCAAAGGFGHAISSVKFPDWFETYRKSYSTGPQAEEAGDVTELPGYVWGAGMVLRRSSIDELFGSGFRSLLSDRKGEELSSGGDVELCYALRLAGYRIFYEPSLRFDHFIRPSRLRWKYLRKLYRGFGHQKPLLEPYIRCYRNPDLHSEISWKREALILANRMKSYGRRNLRDFMRLSEGNSEVLRMEKTLGRLEVLVKLKAQYTSNFKLIKSAGWNKSKGPLP